MKRRRIAAPPQPLAEVAPLRLGVPHVDVRAVVTELRAERGAERQPAPRRVAVIGERRAGDEARIVLLDLVAFDRVR